MNACVWCNNSVAREDETNRQIVIGIVTPIVVHVRGTAIVAVPAIQAVAIAIVLKNRVEAILTPKDDLLIFLCHLFIHSSPSAPQTFIINCYRAPNF